MSLFEAILNDKNLISYSRVGRISKAFVFTDLARKEIAAGEANNIRTVQNDSICAQTKTRRLTNANL